MKKLQSMAVAVFCLTLVLLICGADAAFAQEVTATIAGTVTDQSGAAVAGANVVAKSVERGVTYRPRPRVRSLPDKPPIGNYELRAEKEGFQTSAYPAFTCAQPDCACRCRNEGRAGQPDHRSQWRRPVLKRKRPRSTPLSTPLPTITCSGPRNYVQLTLLAPGSVSTDPSSFNNGNNTGGYGGRPLINGNREQANYFLLDGMDNNQVSDNLLGYTPAPDAIEEFNLITNNAPAEFGSFMGGIVSATIKSGTNNFHGDIWEFFRNNDLNANSWSNNFNNLPKAQLRWNMLVPPGSNHQYCSSSLIIRASASTRFFAGHH